MAAKILKGGHFFFFFYQNPSKRALKWQLVENQGGEGIAHPKLYNVFSFSTRMSARTVFSEIFIFLTLRSHATTSCALHQRRQRCPGTGTWWIRSVCLAASIMTIALSMVVRRLATPLAPTNVCRWRTLRFVARSTGGARRMILLFFPILMEKIQYFDHNFLLKQFHAISSASQ